MQTTLPTNEILVEDRQRVELGDIPRLAESIKTYGILQPIVVDQNKRLLAGGRRLAAAKLLRLPTVPIVYRETLSLDEAYEIELEENVRRKDMSWQERTLNIATIHAAKVSKTLSGGGTTVAWGVRETGELVGVDYGRVSVVLKMATLLKAECDSTNKPREDARFWKCDSFNEAWRLRTRDLEDLAMRQLSQTTAYAETVAQAPTGAGGFDSFDEDLGGPPIETGVSPETPEKAAARERYAANPLNTQPFEDYWQEKTSYVPPAPRIALSNMLHHGDSIAFMLANPGRFDHIVTDIPYGIDMGHLDQQNPHGGMENLDTVKKEHDVDYNRKLIAEFFPAAFACTKEKAFVITWCDQMLWQYMYDLAMAAGFVVQRWPFTWCKTSPCMNQTEQYNRTKNTEIAMVCRKPGTMLVHSAQSSFIVTGKDDICETVNHPFAKPYAIWEALVDPISIVGQTILEPFAGRGSGVLSLLRMKRNVIACELQENHFNYLVENVKQHFLSINKDCTFM